LFIQLLVFSQLFGTGPELRSDQEGRFAVKLFGSACGYLTPSDPVHLCERVLGRSPRCTFWRKTLYSCTAKLRDWQDLFLAE
jgi:hypothetical protein